MPAQKSSTHAPLSAEAAKVLASAVRDARKSAGLTQEALGERSGLSIQHIRRIEAASANPTLGSLEAVAKALQVSLVDLVKSS